MPAVDLKRLKVQSSNLAQKFDQPDQFVRNFIELLNLYHNHTLRTKKGNSEIGYFKYAAPRSVLRQIEYDMQEIGQSHPDQIEDLVLTLWDASFRESRLLAAYLMGTLPPMLALRLFSKLPDWLYQSNDPAVREALLDTSLTRMRNEYPSAMVRLISEWLNSPGQKTNTWGLHALMLLIQHLGFDDLPKVFEILKPEIIKAEPGSFTELQGCINTMYSISPVETAHLLSQLFYENGDKTFRQQFSRLKRGFSPILQKELSGL